MSAPADTKGGGPDAQAPAASADAGTIEARTVVVRNTLLLVVAQFVGAPLSLVINAFMGRYLGPQDFGYIYLATTMASFGFLAVEWGQSGVLPATIARDRSISGVLLGSALAWRVGAMCIVYAVLVGMSKALGYTDAFLTVLTLVVVGFAINSVVGVHLDTVRGFERTDVSAYAVVGQQALFALLVVPTLLLGGGLFSALGAQAAAYSLVLLLVLGVSRSVGIGALRVDGQAIRKLARDGVPFLFLSVILTLQPIVDSVMLSKLATPDAMGWHAAARKLVGAMVFPAMALINALYPTLSRLFVEDKVEYRRMLTGALQTALIGVVPLGVGTALFADVGIMVFSEEKFGPAADNLRVLSLFILLLYFSMVLGSALAAAGKQRPWAIIQLACVLVSVVADPLLIPYFQRTVGNGSLGVCVASVLSEVLMVAAGVWLAPRGTFSRAFFAAMGSATLAGAAMAGAALVLRPLGPFVTMPASAFAYLVVLRLTGGLGAEQLLMLRSVLRRKSRA